MDEVSTVRTTDEIGRFVIPAAIRAKLGIEKGDELEIIEGADSFTVRKYRPRCLFCSATDDLLEYNDKFVCRSCVAVLAEYI